MRLRLKEFIDLPESDTITESLVGKGFAIGQNRAHGSNKTKLQSVLSRIQSNAKRGQTKDDQEKQFDIIFALFFDLATALKIASDMSTNSINVTTTGELDTESIKAELKRVFPHGVRR